MAINLSALSSVTTKANVLSNLLLVTPNSNGIQPQNQAVTPGQTPLSNQPPSILFNYEGEQSLVLDSDITDHYIEDNTAINDQIALRPITITTHGFIGELNDIAPLPLQYLKILADKLTVIDAYTPVLSTTALRAYNEAVLASATALQLVNSAVSTLQNIVGGGAQNQQQKYFMLFYGYWKLRTLFTVQTPWNSFENMAIKSLRAVQEANSNVVTDFEVTFKQMNFSSTLTTGGLQAMQGRANNQSQGLKLLGTSTPTLTGPSLPSLSLLGGAP